VQVPLPPAWPRGMCRRRSIRGWKDRAACRSRRNVMGEPGQESDAAPLLAAGSDLPGSGSRWMELR